jgi:hypothetical protein
VEFNQSSTKKIETRKPKKNPGKTHKMSSIAITKKIDQKYTQMLFPESKITLTNKFK